jgi:insertion element IS1 protein InsB
MLLVLGVKKYFAGVFVKFQSSTLSVKILVIMGERLVKSYDILKSKKHHQVGKESGQTNHIEQYWATLSAKITRYIRKSLSFARKLKYYHLVTKMFIIYYNQNCSSTLS